MSKSIDFMMEYECSDSMPEEKVIEGFQRMLDEGILFKLQGFYGRKGRELLDAGLITIKDGQEVYDYYGNRVYPSTMCADEF